MKKGNQYKKINQNLKRKQKKKPKKLKQNQMAFLRDYFVYLEARALLIKQHKISYMRKMIRNKRKFRKNLKACLLNRKGPK